MSRDAAPRKKRPRRVSLHTVSPRFPLSREKPPGRRPAAPPCRTPCTAAPAEYTRRSSPLLRAHSPHPRRASPAPPPPSAPRGRRRRLSPRRRSQPHKKENPPDAGDGSLSVRRAPGCHRVFLLSGPGVVTTTVSGVMRSAPFTASAPWKSSAAFARSVSITGPSVTYSAVPFT